MQISEQIITVLDDLAQRFGVAIDWGQQNVLPYVQELCGKYISWEIATSIMWICFSAVFIIGGFPFVKLSNIYRNAHKGDYMYEGIGTALLIACAIGCWAIAFGIITTQIVDITRCCIFPELQVFEFIKSMTCQ